MAAGDGVRPAFWVALGAAGVVGGLWLWRANVPGIYALDYRVAEVLLAVAAACLLPVPLLLRAPEPPPGTEAPGASDAPQAGPGPEGPEP